MSSSDPRNLQRSEEQAKPVGTLQPGRNLEYKSTSQETDRTRAETQPQHEGQKAHDQSTASTSPSLFDEIGALQERLLQLEYQATQQWKATVEDHHSEDKEGDQKGESWDSGDEELRKYIRKAPSARREVEKIEKIAEESADKRKEYGQSPNKAEPGGAKSTIYHIQKSGDLHPGDELHALAATGTGWIYTGGSITTSGHDLGKDWEARKRAKPLPQRGVRPPAAMRPFYQTPVRKPYPDPGYGAVPPLRLSKKLGPPTRWDGSDLEEWSSDTSTRSQDFRYFRSRLRGDFEWELDRLNAQVSRFRKHKDKKKSRQLATRTRKANEKREEIFEAYGETGELLAQFELDAKEAGKNEYEHRQIQLHHMGWSEFRLRRALPLQYSFAIDVLVEEPKLSTDIELRGRVNKVKKDQSIHKAGVSLKAASAEDMKSDKSTAWGSKISTPWREEDPLPERIRINSKQIIEKLSNIHGSPLHPEADETSSVTILRPFKILNAYDKKIREECSRLEADSIKTPKVPTAPTDHGRRQTKSDMPTGEESGEASSDLSQETKAAKENDGSDVRQDQCLQLNHLRSLCRFMDEYPGRKLAYLNSARCRKIFFSDVWHMFQPGTTVISANGKQAYRVVQLISKRHKGSSRWDAFWKRRNEKKSGKTDNPDSSDNLGDDIRADITIKCVFIHFDGKSFGPVMQTFQLSKWDGVKEVTYLDIYPLRFHVLRDLHKRSFTSSTTEKVLWQETDIEEGIKELRQRLIDRGRNFLDVAAVKQMYHSGLAVDTRDEIESQVMVDFEEALAHESRKSWIPNIQRLLGNNWNPKTDEADEGCTAECCWDENVHEDAYVETNSTEEFIDDMMAEIKDIPHKLPSAIIFPRTLEEAKAEPNMLTDDELMIMSHFVFGFVLRDRTWAKLDLDCMTAVRSTGSATEQSDDDLEDGGQGAFGQLVLPRGHKEMVLSLISQHFRNKESTEGDDKQSDIVRGKGKGLIILLHGAPGVGKTTTAEGVAETFGQPLFQITCGDLGSNPKDVENALQTNFALANRWGCILLLDEADVFLAERRREDFNRNGLVAVFLRVLEYYAGILFLTTNRIGDFDEAFASRIHMSLHYPALDEVSTAKVFRLNLGIIKNRLQNRVKIDEDEIIMAAGQHWRQHKHARWNGRQIRNACQTALALAEFEAQPKGKKYDIKEKSTAKVHLKLSHLQIVSNAYLEFTEYLKAVHGADAEGRAKEAGLRALVDYIKSDKEERRARDSRPNSPGRGQIDPDTSFQSYRLRTPSGGQSPGRRASPASPEMTSQQAGHQGLYQSQRLPHEPSSVSPHRVQYSQGPYAGTQSFTGDRQAGMRPTAQHVQPGSYLQAPQTYTSSGQGGHGKHQSSDPYMYGSQPMQTQGVSYPSPPPSAIRGGPASGSTGLGQFQDEQGQEAHGGGQLPYDDSEHM